MIEQMGLILDFLNKNTHGYMPPKDETKFVSTRGHTRNATAQDERAFRKRIAKRRAKKGYR